MDLNIDNSVIDSFTNVLFMYILENLINDSNPTETYIIVEDNNHPISISELFEEETEVQLLENCMRVIIY
jgi:hypothetical protein